MKKSMMQLQGSDMKKLKNRAGDKQILVKFKNSK